MIFHPLGQLYYKRNGIRLLTLPLKYTKDSSENFKHKDKAK